MSHAPGADPALIRQQLMLRRTDQDDYLLTLYDAAVAHFNTWTGANLVESGTVPDDLKTGDVPLFPDIKIGLLMAVAHWYEHRETVGEKLSECPMGTYTLWGPYQRYNLGTPH